MTRRATRLAVLDHGEGNARLTSTGAFTHPREPDVAEHRIVEVNRHDLSRRVTVEAQRL
jgi:hypothetical protein